MAFQNTYDPRQPAFDITSFPRTTVAAVETLCAVPWLPLTKQLAELLQNLVLCISTRWARSGCCCRTLLLKGVNAQSLLNHRYQIGILIGPLL